VSTETDGARPADPGLEALVTLLHVQGVAADRGQLRHRLGTDKIGAAEMLRCAKDLGLKARAYRTDWSRLAKTPLPAIAALRDGGFLVVAKAAEDKVLVQSPQASRPALMTRDELLAVWDGGLILMTRRARLSDITRRFDITWFLGAIHKYRRLPGEVLLASFFLQLFGLVSPLFFQVVIDKVLVHRALTTLDVLVIGLLAISVFETVLEPISKLPTAVDRITMSNDSAQGRAVGAHPGSFSGGENCRWTSWAQTDSDPLCARSGAVDSQHRRAMAHAAAELP
jgi:ATP-binding cassette, subfamily B, bacterial HlyB/CyaB